RPAPRQTQNSPLQPASALAQFTLLLRAGSVIRLARRAVALCTKRICSIRRATIGQRPLRLLTRMTSVRHRIALDPDSEFSGNSTSTTKDDPGLGTGTCSS